MPATWKAWAGVRTSPPDSRCLGSDVLAELYPLRSGVCVLEDLHCNVAAVLCSIKGLSLASMTGAMASSLRVDRHSYIAEG